jgi:DNA-directed RNA polymerase subunit RPC12/RpoP
MQQKTVRKIPGGMLSVLDAAQCPACIRRIFRPQRLPLLRQVNARRGGIAKRILFAGSVNREKQRFWSQILTYIIDF